MKNKFFKRIMSLVLVVVMAVSTMAVSAVSASAETTNVTYKFDVHTAGTNGKSSDKISIKVNGDNGSTGWHNVGKVANARTDSASFSDINVGNIQSITVKNDGSNGWYPEYINVTVGDKTTTIYGGRWTDDKKEVTLSVTDRVAKVTVKTSDFEYAGTDASVYVQLFDKNKSSEKINLSEIHPKTNAFERNDKATFYILVPDNFGYSYVIEVETAGSIDEWTFDYIDVTLDGETLRFSDGGSTSIGDGKKLMNPALYVYKVTVKTSDKYLAGTDDNVFLNAYNCYDINLCSYYLDDSKNNFERDDTDVFYITAQERIFDIEISKPGFDGWHLDYVQLDQLDISKGKEDVVNSKLFKFDMWIDDSFLDLMKNSVPIQIPFQ